MTVQTLYYSVVDSLDGSYSDDVPDLPSSLPGLKRSSFLASQAQLNNLVRVGTGWHWLTNVDRTSCLLYLYTHSDCRMTRTSCVYCICIPIVTVDIVLVFTFIHNCLFPSDNHVIHLVVRAGWTNGHATHKQRGKRIIPQ